MEANFPTLIILLVCGGAAAAIANHKGRSAVGWFFGGFFLGLIGIVIVAVLPNLKEEREKHEAHYRERRRLREQLRQEKMKNEAFRRHAVNRLDTHDAVLEIDTRGAEALPDTGRPLSLPERRPAPAGAATAAAGREEEPSGGEWYYMANGDTQGPVDFEKLKELYRDRVITLSSFVWNPDMEDWKTLSAVPELNR